ncbi:MAG: hypothetical protein JRN62_02970 [Nitrososphaerota archaeon]|jgi:hypothetical protein|nr:hypothetical protein [Nitrososphaerota archaeon]MDG6948956.1 hypothetical protein [Nitrososphaerota archaeon]
MEAAQSEAVARQHDLRTEDGEFMLTIASENWEAEEVKEVLSDVRGGDPEQIFHDMKEQEHGSLFETLMYGGYVTRSEPHRLKPAGKALLECLEKHVEEGS